jgi:hypothetical protein
MAGHKPYRKAFTWLVTWLVTSLVTKLITWLVTWLLTNLITWLVTWVSCAGYYYINNYGAHPFYMAVKSGMVGRPSSPVMCLPCAFHVVSSSHRS